MEANNEIRDVTRDVKVTGYGKVVVTLSSAGKPDDILKIVPDTQSNGYYVKFDQETIGTKSNCYVENAGLKAYLGLFFASFQFDISPAEYLQFDCPMFPSIKIKCGKHDDYLSLLMAQIEFLQADWPFETISIADK